MLSKSSRAYARTPAHERIFGLRNKQFLSTLLDFDSPRRSKRAPPQTENEETNQVEREDDVMSSTSSITLVYDQGHY